MKILFMHNTLPEYRIEWFHKMAEMAQCDFLFTNESLNELIYKNQIDYEKAEEIHSVFLSGGLSGFFEASNFFRNISDYDFVEFPPVDSLRELIISLMALKKCKKNRIKTGYFWEKWEAPIEHQIISRKIKNKILCISAKLIFSRSDIIFAGSSKSKEYFINNGVDQGKIVIIPDASEVPQCEYVDLKRKYGIKDQDKIYLYFGRIIEQKGLDILIKAFTEMKNSQNAHLLIAGDGDFKDKCVNLVESTKCKNITFTGAIKPNDRRNFFEQCDVFVFPGTFRGGKVDVWGLTLNEAMQFGKVLISTDAVGSAYDLISNDNNGYMVNAESVTQLVDAMEKSSKQEMKDKAYKYNQEKCKIYSFDAMADVYLKTISSCLSNN